MFLQNGKFGGIYDQVDYINEPEIYFVGVKGNRWVLINSLIDEVDTYDMLLPGGTSLLAAKNKKWGIVNCFNKVMVDFKFDHIDFFGKDYYLVRLNGKYGLIDEAGGEFRKLRYDNADELFKEFGLENNMRIPELI